MLQYSIHQAMFTFFSFLFTLIPTELKCTYKNVKQIQTNWMEKNAERKKWFVEMDFILFVQHPKITISLLVLLS